MEPETVGMVYSYNHEFGAVRPKEAYSVDQAGQAEQLWLLMKKTTDFGRWKGNYNSLTPVEAVQPQAADLFAYELSQEFENLRLRPKDPMRWALRQTLQLVDYPYSPTPRRKRSAIKRLWNAAETPRTSLITACGFKNLSLCRTAQCFYSRSVSLADNWS